MKKILKSKTLVIFFIISLLAFHLIGCDNAVQEPTATENVQVVEAEQQEVAATPDENVTEENMTPKNDVVEENAAESAENAEDVDVEIDVEANTESEENVTEETTAEETEEEAEEIVEEEVVAEEIATPEVVPVPETSQVSTSIKPSDFKFCGYPVNENHYQEWKTALGYTGDDSTYSIQNTNLELIVSCQNNEMINDISLLHSSLSFSWCHWGHCKGINLASREEGYFGDDIFGKTYNSTFYIIFNPSFSEISKINLSSPLTSDMSYNEVKQIVGFDETAYVDKDSYKVCTLVDGTQILLKDYILIFNSEYEIQINFENDKIDTMFVFFNL